MKATTFIYALLEPSSKKIRYLGKSVNPKERFAHHLVPANPPRTHKECWISGLRSKGSRPILEILDEVPTSQAGFFEQEYIRVFRALGMDLTNLSDGGEGQTGYVHTEETKKKISNRLVGRKDSEETKKRKSLASSLRDNSHLFGNTHLLGHVHSEETRKQMSESHLGMPGPNLGRRLPEEWRKAIGAGGRGVKQKGSSSRFLGVYWSRKLKRWVSKFYFGGKSKTLGQFKVEEDAARAYDKEARRVIGPNAKVNFP